MVSTKVLALTGTFKWVVGIFWENVYYFSFLVLFWDRYSSFGEIISVGGCSVYFDYYELRIGIFKVHLICN